MDFCVCVEELGRHALYRMSLDLKISVLLVCRGGYVSLAGICKLTTDLQKCKHDNLFSDQVLAESTSFESGFSFGHLRNIHIVILKDVFYTCLSILLATLDYRVRGTCVPTRAFHARIAR